MSLPAIRALGKSGVPVVCTERDVCDTKAALGFYSKYSKRNVLLPDADTDTALFLSELSSLCSDLDERPVVIPVGISTLLTLCENRDEVLGFCDCALPPFSSIELANNKSRLIPFAKEAGVPVPETTFKADGESVLSLSQRITYPSVIKLPLGEMLGLPPEKRYSIVSSKEEFIKTYTVFEQYGQEILVQQYITGDGYGVSCVFDKNSEPLEVFCHRRIREYPSSGGPSCFCESVDSPQLAEYAIKLLRTLHWEGVAMVEFKGTPETGFYLMEINPRFWGSSALAPNSGCNIPFALYRAARGELAKPFSSFSPSYKTGHKMRFIIQDLLSFPAYLKKSEHKLKFAVSFLSGLLNPFVSDGVFDISDIRSSLQYFKQALKKTDSIVR
ncbi:MAG: ATP-grasp domain-containing protein [Oscillospiraceae bacterium]|nr:ATP-grasp domain-containing protein [Oscillospiraceae bacterium]